MRIRRLVAAALLATACGRKPVEEPPPPPPQGATRAEPASSTLELLGNPAGFYPLSLSAAVTVAATAGTPASVALPLPFSAQAAWLALRSKAAANVTVGGRPVALAANGPSVWALAEVERGKVALTADADVELSVRATGYLDESGAGLVVAEEPALEQGIPSGVTTLSLASELDDTWGLWLRVTATAGERDVSFELRGCGSDDAYEQLQVPAGQHREAFVLAPRAVVCAYGSEPLTVKLEPVARYRRFTRTQSHAVTPVTVLDTEQGIGWKGTPLAAQSLAVDLSKLGGAEGASVAVLRLTGVALSAGPCGAEAVSTGLVVHDLSKPLCVVAGEAQHVRAELLALVKPGEPEPLSCPALPEPGACSATDLLGQLNCVPGVTATAGPAVDQYTVQVTQPVDHARPDGPTFHQRILLTYLGPTAPVVLHTTGYELFTYRSDLGKHLNATELEVEHRFFGTSSPAPRDFATMDIVQSAQDSHRIVELLRPVLRGKWLSTGHSKGGMTALFHRRFFPCDVDGSVPYVTPLSQSLSDDRYGKALQELGGAKYAACRQVFRDIDRGIISGRAQFAAQLRGSYSKVGSPELALWELTGMMSWGLFQYENLDDPDRGCPAYEALGADPAYLAQAAAYYARSAESYSDEALASQQNDPLFGYVYQTTNELGGQGASRDHLSDLATLPALPAVEPLSLGSVPVPKFEPRSMRDIQEWVKAHGSRFIFVYGEFDPWFAGAVDITGTREALELVAPGKNHGARIADLTAADQLAADALLQRWLGSTGPRPLVRTTSSLDARPEFRDVMKALRL